jgi:hypothetical protein
MPFIKNKRFTHTFSQLEKIQPSCSTPHLYKFLYSQSDFPSSFLLLPTKTVTYRANFLNLLHPIFLLDGLVKSPIYFVEGRKRRLAVPHVLPSRRLRHYASESVAYLYIELFSESIRAVYTTFYEIILLYKADNSCPDNIFIFFNTFYHGIRNRGFNINNIVPNSPI